MDLLSQAKTVTGIAKFFQKIFEREEDKIQAIADKKEKNIEEAFLCLPSVNKKVSEVGSLVSAQYLGTGSLVGANIDSTNESTFDRLRYLLTYELKASERIIKLMEDLDLDINLTMYIITYHLLDQAELAAKNNALNTKLQNVISQFNGDYKQATAACHQKAKQTADQLKNEIEVFLKSQKNIYRNDINKGNYFIAGISLVVVMMWAFLLAPYVSQFGVISLPLIPSVLFGLLTVGLSCTGLVGVYSTVLRQGFFHSSGKLILAILVQTCLIFSLFNFINFINFVVFAVQYGNSSTPQRMGSSFIKDKMVCGNELNVTQVTYVRENKDKIRILCPVSNTMQSLFYNTKVIGNE